MCGGVDVGGGGEKGGGGGVINSSLCYVISNLNGVCILRRVNWMESDTPLTITYTKVSVSHIEGTE